MSNSSNVMVRPLHLSKNLCVNELLLWFTGFWTSTAGGTVNSSNVCVCWISSTVVASRRLCWSKREAPSRPEAFWCLPSCCLTSLMWKVILWATVASSLSKLYGWTKFASQSLSGRQNPVLLRVSYIARLDFFHLARGSVDKMFFW